MYTFSQVSAQYEYFENFDFQNLYDPLMTCYNIA